MATKQDEDDRDAFLVIAGLYAMGFRDDEVVIHASRYVALQAQERRTSYEKTPFNLDSYDDVTSRRHFRFSVDEIRLIQTHLQLPTTIYTKQMCAIPREEALCMLLRRLAYPARLQDLEQEFHRSSPAISSAINVTVALVYDKIQDKMRFDHRMVARYKARSAEAIFRKVGRLGECLGFIDGTIQRTCRPTLYQDRVYSGHKKHHGLKFQNITMANGLIVQMYGPLEGRRHDSFMLEESVVVDDMARHADYYLYGDQGYPVRGWLITPFANARKTPEQLRFNRDLSRARIAVEWSFGWIARYWKFFSLVDNMKIFKSPIGAMFVIAAFFTNCISCSRRRNQASKYFRCRLPTLEIYLADLLHDDINEADYMSDEDDQLFFDDESDLSSDDENDELDEVDDGISEDGTDNEE